MGGVEAPAGSITAAVLNLEAGTGQLSLGVGRRSANPDYGELTVVMRGNLALWSVWKATTARRVAAAAGHVGRP